MYTKTNQLFKGLFALLFVAAISFTSCNNEAEKTETTDSVTTPAPEPAAAAPDSTANDTDKMDSGGVKPVVTTRPK